MNLGNKHTVSYQLKSFEFPEFRTEQTVSIAETSQLTLRVRDVSVWQVSI